MRSLYARLNQRFGVMAPAAERRRDVQARVARFQERLDAQIQFTAATTGRRGSVVIAGAGFAGLMAASVLAQARFDVTVLEARDRAGGRVWTLIDGDRRRAVEAGAELIGYNHPTWLSLANKFGLGFLVLSSEEAFTALDLDGPLYLDGRLLSSKESEGVYNEMDRFEHLRRSGQGVSRSARKPSAIRRPKSPFLLASMRSISSEQIGTARWSTAELLDR